MSPSLLVVITDAAGQRWFHRSRWRTLTAGRSEACELVLASSRVSRRHLHVALSAEPGKLVITDLGSSGGSIVNGLRTDGRTEVPDGAVVEVGPFLLEVFREGDLQKDAVPKDARPWPHLGGAVAPAPPDRPPLADDAEAISFRALIQWSTSRPLPVALAVALGGQLLEEIQRYHARGQLVHTVPPEWVWVGKHGAVALRPEAPPEMAVGGAFDHYGSPELFERPDADVRSDIFAAGLVLYELLTGKHPFPDAGRRTGTLPLRGPVPDLRMARSDVSRELAEVLRTALEACPDDRFASVPGFIRDLDRALDAHRGDLLDVPLGEPIGAPLGQGLSAALEPYFDGSPPPQVSIDAADEGSDAPFLVRLEVEDPDGETSERVFPGHVFPGRGEISIGRHHSNDLVLLSLRMSRRHGRFRFEEGRILLEDLGSANGTYLNGQKLRRPTPVAVGDRIEMGGLRIRLKLEEAPAPHLFVVLHKGDDPPRRVALHGRTKVTVGSDAEAELLLEGEGVAPRHARLIVWGERLQLEDLGASPGTTVAGDPVVGTRLLAAHDLVSIGPWRLSAALDQWPDAEARDSLVDATLLPAPGDLVPGFGGPTSLTQVVVVGGLPMFRTRRKANKAAPAAALVEQFDTTVKKLKEVRSPHLFPVAGGGFEKDGVYLDRPSLPGATLLALAREPIPLDVVLAIGEGVIEGMRAFCELGLLQTAAEPLTCRTDLGHVFLRADGRVLWLGLSVAAPVATSSPEDTLGWAPELVADPERKLDEKALLFGLGSLLYRAVSGRAPFVRDSTLETQRAIVRDKPLNPREIVPSCPVDFVRYLSGLLEKEPERRFDDFDQALVELRAVRELAGVGGQPARLAVRGWLKAAALRSAESAGPAFEEVTSEIQLSLVTDEGPASEG